MELKPGTSGEECGESALKHVISVWRLQAMGWQRIDEAGQEMRWHPMGWFISKPIANGGKAYLRGRDAADARGLLASAIPSS
jgi:hypothetical protein